MIIQRLFHLSYITPDYHVIQLLQSMINTLTPLKTWSPEKPDLNQISTFNKHKSIIWRFISTLAKGLFTFENPFRSQEPAWKVSCSNDRTQLAILQEDQLEVIHLVQHSKDYRVDIATDKITSLRNLCWSLDGKCIIYSSSLGEIIVFGTKRRHILATMSGDGIFLKKIFAIQSENTNQLSFITINRDNHITLHRITFTLKSSEDYIERKGPFAISKISSGMGCILDAAYKISANSIVIAFKIHTLEK